MNLWHMSSRKRMKHSSLRLEMILEIGSFASLRMTFRARTPKSICHSEFAKATEESD